MTTKIYLMRYGNDFPLNGIKYHERKTKMSEDEKLAEMKAFWNPGKRMVCKYGKTCKKDCWDCQDFVDSGVIFLDATELENKGNPK